MRNVHVDVESVGTRTCQRAKCRKTTVGEQIDTVHDVNDGDARMSSHKIPAWEEKTQSVDAEDSVEDRATFETERQSNLRQLRLKSMCYEFELAESREALDRVSATDKKNSTARRIQKIWKFDHIAEVQVRPYSGLRKNADAARRPSSSIDLNRTNMITYQQRRDRIQVYSRVPGT